VLRAEQGLRARNPEPAALPEPLPPGAPGDRFRRAFLAAYGEGPLPAPSEREEVHRRLGQAYAADLLEARLLDREGGGEALRQRAREALIHRLVGLGLLGLLVLLLVSGGLVLGAFLLATRDRPPGLPLPQWELTGRGAAVVMLAWFLGFFLSGQVAHLLLSPWPAARGLVPPFGYLLHASLGLFLLGQAEGLGLGELWRRVAPGRAGRDLAWGGAFLGLAVLLALTAALLTDALLRPEQSPQRDLQDLVRALSGWGPNLAMFLTVAGLAPLFEETLFRGFLFPVLARGGRTTLALLVSSLLFGAIHLQPTGLPVLCALGLAMGLAMRHTGSLRAPILVHACWNGGLFLLMKVFA
jgi:membrane protease YdiL (CAAX protease family)